MGPRGSLPALRQATVFRTFFEACDRSISRRRCFLGFHKNVKKIIQRKAGGFFLSQKKVFFVHFLSTFGHLCLWGIFDCAFFFQKLSKKINLRMIEWFFRDLKISVSLVKFVFCFSFLCAKKWVPEW